MEQTFYKNHQIKLWAQVYTEFKINLTSEAYKTIFKLS